MRILHTSDWHLGHTLHDLPREYEHQRFLDWLLEAIGAHEVDALLVAGDVFDTANPSAAAQRIFYRFLADLRARHPALDVVVIGGNHDSADRLDAPHPLLAGFDLHVVGGLPRGVDGALDHDRLLVPLRRRDGAIGAWVAAVPFLRPADLPPVEEDGDRLVAGVRAIYADVLAAARARREPGQALVAMGHCYMMEGEVSEWSERKILGGNQHALPLDLFPADLAYVALGHLHRPQRLGSDRIRYSGSPLPLSMAEIDYPHQVCLVDFDGERLAGVTELRVPRAVELIRLPRRGALEPAELLAEVQKLRPVESGPPPFLEVRVRLTQPDPALRHKVEEALAEGAARLVRIGVELSGDGRSLADQAGGKMLDELQPGEIFAACWRSRYGTEPRPEMVAAFHELLEEVKGEAR